MSNEVLLVKMHLILPLFSGYLESQMALNLFCYIFSYSLYLFAKHKLCVSISRVVCSYLTCTACVMQALKAHTVNEIVIYIKNKLISVKCKLQVNGN